MFTEVAVRKHLVVLTTYTLTALVMTWPLALNFSSAIPGVEGDATSYLWALGWAKTALVDLRVNPFHTDFVFYPLGGATQLLWAVSLVGFISIPLQFLVGLIAAHNLLYLAATVLTAYGTFLLADDVLARSECGMRNSKIAAFTAGLVFAFAPLRLGYGLAFLNLFNTEFIPFYTLFLIRATREKSWRDAILAGIFLGLSAYIDFQIAAFLILLTGLYVLYELILERRVAWETSVHWTVVGLVAAGVAVPLLLAVANDFAGEGGNYIRVYKLDYSAERSYDLLSFFVPNARGTLYANAPLKVANVNFAVRAGDESALSPDRQAFVGYVVLALAAYATLRRWRAARFWFCAAIIFALFSLGPWLRVLGQTTSVPLPYLALHEIPILNHIRIPMRYGIMVFFALAMMAAIAIQNPKIENRKHFHRTQARVSKSVIGLLPAAILLEYAVFPYPLQTVSLPRVYDEIARVPGDFSILEIPTFNWRGAAASEVYQAIHHKRILRAYTNRIAPGPAEYFGLRGTPIVVRSLRLLEDAEAGGLSPDEIAEDKRVRDEVLQFFDLRYAVAHRQFLKPDETRKIDQYLREALAARVISDDGETIAYELPRAANAPGAVLIDLRENIGQMYAGRGWQFEYPPANWEGEFNFVWARGAQSEIYFVATGAADRVMTLHAYAVLPLRVSISVNGKRIDEITLLPEWRDYRMVLPARVVSKMNVVRLSYSAGLERVFGVTRIQIE